VPSRDHAVQQIRFALGQLRARNGQHEFETLCRLFTQLRIASNVLPATGPVGAGGDQGRDFETFKTYLRDLGGGSSTFVGRVADGVLVGACTLQQDDIATKIRGDVAKILGSGPKPNDIMYFCEVNVPVGTRHGL
jgi:hypothetical protein